MHTKLKIWLEKNQDWMLASELKNKLKNKIEYNNII